MNFAEKLGRPIDIFYFIPASGNCNAEMSSGKHKQTKK